MKFKEGMKVVWIDPDCVGCMTYGNTYSVLRDQEDTAGREGIVYIANDQGKEAGYFAFRFKPARPNRKLPDWF